MTKEYFYTDPLAASWMAKHFGMKFTAKDGYPHSFGLVLGVERGGDTFYVHPDSIHLLEPQVGDYVDAGGNGAWLVIDDVDPRRSGQCIRAGAAKWRDESKIIQRNDKAFMWPESEAS